MLRRKVDAILFERHSHHRKDVRRNTLRMPALPVIDEHVAPEVHVPAWKVSLQGMQNAEHGLALVVAVGHGLAVRLGILDPFGNLFGRTGNLGRHHHSLVGHATTPADGQPPSGAKHRSGWGRRHDNPVRRLVDPVSRVRPQTGRRLAEWKLCSATVWSRAGSVVDCGAR